jgi:hypothetical protein
MEIGRSRPMLFENLLSKDEYLKSLHEIIDFSKRKSDPYYNSNAYYKSNAFYESDVDARVASHNLDVATSFCGVGF